MASRSLQSVHFDMIKSTIRYITALTPKTGQLNSIGNVGVEALNKHSRDPYISNTLQLPNLGDERGEVSNN